MSIDSYYEIESTSQGRRYHFLDPLSGNRLASNCPPYCLMQDERLKFGADYFQSAKNRLTVNLVLSPHGCATDMNNIVDDCAAAFANIIPFCGVETDWISDGSDFPTRPSQILTVGSVGRREFQLAQLNWLGENYITPLPCECEETRPTPLTIHLKALWAMYEKIYDNSSYDSRKKRALAVGAYQAIRHWIMPMQLGYWLGQLDQVGALVKTTPRKVPLILGHWHMLTQAKIKQLGADVAVYRSRSVVGSKAGDAFMKLINDSSILDEDVCDLLID